MRALLIVTVLVLSFQTSGLGAAFGDPECDCPTDESGGQCPPNCRDCGCCSTPRSLLSRLVPASPITKIAAVTWPPVRLRPPSPDPRAILHVPKAALA